MTVYLGTYGLVELRRTSELAEKVSTVNPSDVNATRKRFSFDFDTGFLHSGDQVEIRSTNNSQLDFVAATGWANNTVQTAGKWYVNVDELGGIRLYDTFDKAIQGLESQAIALTSTANTIPIAVTIENIVPRILTQCTYFELSTSREAVDTTALGDEFRSQYAGLISGSGSFRSFWEYLPTHEQNQTGESSHYVLQLAARTEIGSKFAAKFYLKARGGAAVATNAIDDEVWYEVDGVITQAGVNFSPDSAIEVSADFVTTGPIRLLAKTVPSNKVLQENTDDILLEQGTGAALIQEQTG